MACRFCGIISVLIGSTTLRHLAIKRRRTRGDGIFSITLDTSPSILHPMYILTPHTSPPIDLSPPIHASHFYLHHPPYIHHPRYLHHAERAMRMLFQPRTVLCKTHSFQPRDFGDCPPVEGHEGPSRKAPTLFHEPKTGTLPRLSHGCNDVRTIRQQTRAP